MNAKTVQKWIRKNAPDYMLVRRKFVETQARQLDHYRKLEQLAIGVVEAHKTHDPDVLDPWVAKLTDQLAKPLPRATDDVEAEVVDG